MSKFDNWPENLPREDLLRLLRGYTKECHYVEQIIAEAIPESYPLYDDTLGNPEWEFDGVTKPQRAVGDATPTSMAMHAARRISELQQALRVLDDSWHQKWLDG